MSRIVIVLDHFLFVLWIYIIGTSVEGNTSQGLGGEGDGMVGSPLLM
jgi:hypothetical protein